jgi:hypothetical protein
MKPARKIAFSFIPLALSASIACEAKIPPRLETTAWDFADAAQA